jgi:hypothetical protein
VSHFVVDHEGADDSARRKFAPDDYWVMSSQMDLQGFVEAAV